MGAPRGNCNACKGVRKKYSKLKVYKIHGIRKYDWKAEAKRQRQLFKASLKKQGIKLMNYHKDTGDG